MIDRLLAVAVIVVAWCVAFVVVAAFWAAVLNAVCSPP